MEIVPPDLDRCHRQISYENGAKLLRGELKGSVAMMTGKLKVNGDVVKVLRAGNSLEHLPAIAEKLDVEY